MTTEWSLTCSNNLGLCTAMACFHVILISLSTTFCLCTLPLCIWFHYDIAMDYSMAMEFHCDIMMGLNVAMGTYHLVTMHTDVPRILIYYVIIDIWSRSKPLATWLAVWSFRHVLSIFVSQSKGSDSIPTVEISELQHWWYKLKNTKLFKEHMGCWI